MLWTAVLSTAYACVACVPSGVVVATHRAPAGAMTGNAVVELAHETRGGDVLVDRDVVTAFDRRTRVISVQRLPLGPHVIEVRGWDGLVQGVQVRIVRGTTKVRAVPTAPVVVGGPPLPHPTHTRSDRPCTLFAFVVSFGLGGRLCVPIGGHVTIDGQLTDAPLVVAAAEFGASVHFGSDSIPYLAGRVGVMSTELGSGPYVGPRLGWRFSRYFIEAGLSWYRLSEKGSTIEGVVPALALGVQF